jgi:hypothetical protein
LACSSPIRVAVLPLISSVRIAARNGVALDGVGFSVDGKGVLPRQPSNAAPTQAPPDARNQRRECARTNALLLFLNWRVQITSKGRLGHSKIVVILVTWPTQTAAAGHLSGEALYPKRMRALRSSVVGTVPPCAYLADRLGRMGRLGTDPSRVLFLWQKFSFL